MNSINIRLGERKLDFTIDGEVIHPNIKVLRTIAHFQNSWKYLDKEAQNEQLQRYIRGSGDSNDKSKRKNEELNELRGWLVKQRSWRDVLNDSEHTYMVSRNLKLCQEWWQTRTPDIKCDITLKQWQTDLLTALNEGLFTS
mgnify:FL=1